MSVMPKLAVVIRDTQSSKDPLCPYVPQHSAAYDFRPFVGIGKAFVVAVAGAFAVRVSGLRWGTAKQRHYSIKILLRWIAHNRKLFPVFREKLVNDYQSISVDEWEAVLNTWRDDFVNGERPLTESTRSQVLRAVNVLLEALITARVIRPISRLVPVKDSNKKVIPKKCLAEASVRQPSTRPAHKKTKGEGLDVQIEAIACLNEKRLKDLRKCAEQELRKWSDHFKEGQNILALSDMPFIEIRKILRTRYRNNTFRIRALRRLFPKDQPKIALARYLTYILNEHGGVIPFRLTTLRQYHYDFCRYRGGIDEVRSYLTPAPEAANAVRLIFLIDTGVNVSVCYSLNRDCISPSDNPGHIVVTGFKDRARGKPILSELPIRDSRYEISCAQALMTYLDMSKWLSKAAPKPVRHRLFLHAYKSETIRPITYSVAGKQFKAFLARHKEFSGLDFRVDMMRPTVLFQSIYANRGNLIAANALGDHAHFSTTSYYANKPSLRLLYQRLTRDFQQLFQVVAISDIEGAASKLEMNNSEFRRLLREAHRTGLGVTCLNPRAGYQPASVKGEDCTTLEKCPTCPLRFVVATVPNITDLVLFYWHLQNNRPEFEATRPERWLQTWLPWLVFAEVALEKVQRGPTASIYLAAKTAAEGRIASGTVDFPPLW